MNNKQYKHVQDLCEITQVKYEYKLKVPLTKTTYHKTKEDAIATRDKTIRKLLWVPPY